MKTVKSQNAILKDTVDKLMDSMDLLTKLALTLGDADVEQKETMANLMEAKKKQTSKLEEDKKMAEKSEAELAKQDPQETSMTASAANAST